MDSPRTASESEAGGRGRRLLAEVFATQGTVEDLLYALKRPHNHPRHPMSTGIAPIDTLLRKPTFSNRKLSISGRGLALLYAVVDHLVDGLGGTVAVVDLEGRFSPSHLRCEVGHVHVFRVGAGKTGNVGIGEVMGEVERYMMGGGHGSWGREWVATVVNGGVGGDVMVGWMGWLRVEREEVEGFAAEIGVDEALEMREEKQEELDKRGWTAATEDGKATWRE